MRKPFWFVSLVLALLLAAAPALGAFRVLEDRDSEFDGVRVCVVKLDLKTGAKIYYVDENSNDAFDHGIDTVRSVKVFTLSRYTAIQPAPDRAQNAPLQ